MWRGIKQIINTKGRKMSFPSTLEVNGNRLVDTKSIANAFNEYFTSVGPMLANSIQPGNRSFKDFMSPSPCHSSYLKPVTPMEVEDTFLFLA